MNTTASKYFVWTNPHFLKIFFFFLQKNFFSEVQRTDIIWWYPCVVQKKFFFSLSENPKKNFYPPIFPKVRKKKFQKMRVRPHNFFWSGRIHLFSKYWANPHFLKFFFFPLRKSKKKFFTPIFPEAQKKKIFKKCGFVHTNFFEAVVFIFFQKYWANPHFWEKKKISKHAGSPGTLKKMNTTASAKKCGFVH